MKRKFTTLLKPMMPVKDACGRRLLKISFVFSFLLFLLQGVCFAQPTVLGTEIVNGSYVTYNLNTIGGFKQVRIQALNNASSGLLKWEFWTGTAAAPNYGGDVWRPYSSGLTLSGYNTYVPPVGGTASALYNSSSGGQGGLLPAVTANNYYTFNITNNAAANNSMSVLETTYNPETITSVTQSPATVGGTVSPTITVVMSSAPVSNVYVRYSTDNFVTSTLVQLSFAGATGTATIPAQASGATVRYYVYSSPKTSAQIGTDVGTYGQAAHDMATLNLNNNAGANYVYTVLPVTVNASNSGNDASYSTVKAAFDAINAGTHTGTINIWISGNTTETASAVLNASGAPSSYTSVTIKPSGIRTVTGNLTAPLIDLNGADNVTIDGLFDGTNTLTITNSSTSNTAGTSTIRMYNTATSNTVQNCFIEGSTTDASGGIVFLGTGANNTISLTTNTIRPSGANQPVNSVYASSAGTNTGVSVVGNFIQDYFSATATSTGVFAGTGSNTWTVSNNRFYQTASRTITGSAVNARAIWITAGGGHTISNNTIGYATSGGGGTTTYITTNTNNQVIPIQLDGNATVSSIQGNIITAFTITSASNLTSATPAGIFTGIYVSSGAANIGTVTGNIIGATTGTGSISISCSVTGIQLAFSGICVSSSAPNTVNIQNNNIGSLTIAGTSATVQFVFQAIYVPVSTANYSITDNLIGSTSTANSVAIASASTSNATFIAIVSAASGTINVAGNTIQNCTLNTTGFGVLQGIQVASTTGVLSITNNNIISCTNAGTGGFTAIYNTAPASTLNISDNVIRSNTITSGSGLFTGIYNVAIVTTAININNNKLGNASGGLITFSVANTTNVTGINNAAGASTATLTIQSNDFRGITHNVAGSGNHTYILNGAATLSQNINTNTFTALSVNTTGGVTFISNSVSLGATGTKIIKDNSIVTSFTKTGGGSNIYFYFDAGSSVAGATITNEGNNFSNITINGAIPVQGWFNTDGSGAVPVKNIYNNTFNNITANTSGIFPIQVTNGAGGIYGNTITNCSAPNTVTGLTVTAGAFSIYSNTINSLSSSTSFAGVTGINISGGTTHNIYYNTIHTLTSSATSTTVAGIAVSSGTTVNIYKNKIYGLSMSAAITTGGVNGINITGGTTVSVYNNLVGAFTTPAANFDDAIRGMSITGGATVRVYYNTVYLNASSSGASFGSSAMYASNTPSLDMRNNILYNISTPGATGRTIAYRRNGTALTNYAASSDNNFFLAGTPVSATRAIYYDGTNTDQTLAAYQTRVGTPKDTSSLTATSLPFVSTTGSSLNFLHINGSSVAESGAEQIAGFTDDYDDEVRQGNPGYPIANTGTRPDIGADEFESIVCPGTPTITSISAGPYYAGDALTITGTNLSGITYATMNGIDAVIGATTATTAVLTIPVTLTDSIGLIQVAYTSACPYSTINAASTFVFAGFITKGSGTGSGTWSTATIWRNDALPVNNAPAIINNGDAVTLNVSADPIKFTINSTATFTHATSNSNVFGNTFLNNTTVNGTLVIDNAATPILTSASRFISPKLMVNNGGVFTNNSANAAAVTIASFYVYAGGTYNHNAVGSTAAGIVNDFPGSTLRSYGNTSNVVVTKWGNSVSVAPINLPASGSPGWGNLTINVASLGGSWNQAGLLTNVQGNMLVQATGGGTNQFQLMNGGSGTNATSIAGNLTVSGGSFACANGSSVSYTTTVSGNLLVNGTGTVFQVSRGSIASDILNVTGSATFTGTAAFSNTGTTGNAVTPGVVMNFASLDVTGSSTFTPSTSSSCYSGVNVTGAFTVTGGIVSNGSGVQYRYSAGSFTVSSGSFSPGGSNSSIFDMAVSGNFTVSGTGSFASASNGNKVITIGGDFIQSSNSATAFQMQGSTSTAGRIYKLTIGGNFTMTNGTFIGGSSLAPDSIIFNGGLATVNYTQSAPSAFAVSSPANSRNNFAIYSGKTVNLLNSFTPASTGASNANSFTVYNGGVLNCGATSEIGGANNYTTFILNSGATIQTAHTGGVFSTTAAAASITTTVANATLSSGATYVFNGVAPQVSSAFTTTPTASTVANMVINNSTGVTLSASYDVTAALQMQTGNLTLSTFNLTTASITGAPFSNTKMVVTNSTGALGQPVALATILYPVGNSGNYTPASYTFSTNSTARFLNVRAVTPRNTNDLSSTNYINNRWWNTDLSVTTGTYTYTSSYTFMPADIVGVAASIRLNRWNGSAWISDASSSITGNVLNSGTLTEATGTLAATAEWVGRVYTAPAVYTWTNPVNGSWLDATKWTPTGVPGSGDGVIFDKAGSYNVFNMPVGITLTQMHNTGSTLNLRASGTGIVNISTAGTAPQFRISAGATTTLDSLNAVNINILAGASGNISGSLNLQRTTHTLTVVTAGNFVVSSGGYFSYGSLSNTGYSGNPFGTTGTNGSVLFQNGSVCECFEGANPFGNLITDNLTTFQAGSLFRFSHGPLSVASPSVSGRTYSNFTYNSNKITSIAAANSFICDSLTVTVGTFNLNLQGTPTPDHSIRGNINVVSGATLSFTPGVAGTINMNSGATQIIWGGGTFNVNALSTFDINAGTTASLQKNMSAVGTGNVQINGTLICTGENYIGSTGIVSLNNGGTISMQSVDGISNLGIGNIRTSTFTRNPGGNFTYSGTTNQVTGNMLPVTLSGTPLSTLTIANTGTAPNNVVTLTTNNTQTARIILTAGQFNAGTGGTLIIGGGTNLVVGNGGNQYLSGSATDNIIRFASNGAVQNTPELWNVTIGTSGTGVDFQSNARVNGILLINAGGFVVNNAPNYNTGSYLIYNTGGFYNRNIEWSNNSGLGTPAYPHHVTVQNGTTLDVQNPGFNLGCGGNLTLGNTTAGTLVLSSYVQPYDLFVKGDINIGGTAAGTLTMSNSVGCDLFLTGNWTRSAAGSVNFGGGNGRSVYFEGNTDAVITANGGQYFPYVRMQKTNKTNKVTLADHVSIGFEVTFTKGTLDLGTNNKFFSLLSNVNYDARVDVSDSANTAFVYGADDINGQFIVQRYMPARRAWRLVNAPLKPGGGTHNISQAWQEQGNGSNGRDYTAANWSASVLADSISAAYGTQITGNSSVSTGFDLSPNNQSSIKYFAGAGTWSTPLNTNATGVNSKEGWLLFVRGDRKNYGEITNQYKTPTITTLRPRGQIFLGQKTITSSGLTTVGNPYASAVDYFTMTRTGPGLWPANPTYYVWDPSLGGSAGVGAFVTLTWNGTNFTRISTGYGTGNYDNRYIPSGAAIMVDFPAGGGTLSMNEANKNTDSNTTAFRPVRQLSTLLQSKDTDNTVFVADGAVNLFGNDFNNEADINDARKLGNINENFCLKRDGNFLSIERKKLNADADTIFYYMSKMQKKNYQLKFIMDNIELPSSATAFLEDTYLKTKIPVSITGTSEIEFVITDDVASAASDRFRLVFRKSVAYTNISADVFNTDVAINWNVASEWNIDHYEIERSSNGNNFTKVAEKVSSGDNDSQVSYNAVDKELHPGEYYYRVKSVSKNGVIAYSDVVKARVLNAGPGMYVFPNPVTDNNIQLQMNKATAGEYYLRLVGANGQLVVSSIVKHVGGNATHILKPVNKLMSGVYQLEVISQDNKINTIKVVVNNK